MLLLGCSVRGAEVIVGGEVENPGKVALSNGVTVGEVMKTAAPFTSGAANRIRVYRGAMIREVSLKRDPGYRLESGDVVEVPQKVAMEGCGPTGAGDLKLLKVGLTMETIATLLSRPGLEVRANWRGGKAGIEVRPREDRDNREWNWVFIRILATEEIPGPALAGLKRRPGYQEGSVVAEIIASGYPTTFKCEIFEVLMREAGLSRVGS